MRPFVIDANLDCEARWSGAALPPAIARRASAYGSLVAALAPPGRAVEVWAPAAVDASRLGTIGAIDPAGWPPAMRVGKPERADLAWARHDARAANDRRLAHEVAASIGMGLRGAAVVDSPGALDAAIAALGAPGRWVVKTPWTTAGRDRCHGEGPPTSDQRTRLARLFERSGALVVEPWLARVLDVGMCGQVDEVGAVTVLPPHALRVDARGTFLGIDLDAPPLLEPERRALETAVRAAGAALARLAYTGPFAVDAFAYVDGDVRRFHPLCEINARYTFGWVARALHERLGIRRLGFSSPPGGAIVLVAPRDDGVCAWVA